MGLSCPLGISRFVPAKAKFFSVIFWPYNKSVIDQACLVKMDEYWPRSLFVFLLYVYSVREWNASIFAEGCFWRTCRLRRIHYS